MRKVLWVSSSKRISSFMTITSPVSRCVTWPGAQGLSHPPPSWGAETPTLVPPAHLDGLAEAALAQHLPVDEVRGAEDAVGAGHDAQGLGAPDVLALGCGRAHGARARGLVRAAAPPVGWMGRAQCVGGTQQGRGQGVALRDSTLAHGSGVPAGHGGWRAQGAAQGGQGAACQPWLLAQGLMGVVLDG